jgi:hypothetical protein
MEKLRFFLNQFDPDDFKEKIKFKLQAIEQYDLETLVIITFFFLTICVGIYLAFNMGDFI